MTRSGLQSPLPFCPFGSEENVTTYQKGHSLVGEKKRGRVCRLKVGARVGRKALIRIAASGLALLGAVWMSAGMTKAEEIMGSAPTSEGAMKVEDFPGIAGPDVPVAEPADAVEPGDTVEPGGQDAQPMRVRVLAYNLHHGEGVDGVVDLQRTAAAVRSVDPDIVFLSEVDSNWTRSQYEHQAERLAELLNMPFHAYHPNLRAVDWHGLTAYGNAILSRYPIVRTQNHPLPRRALAEPRSLLEARIAVGSKLVDVFGTHLTPKTSEQSDQLDEVLRVAGPSDADLQVLVGDFNAAPYSKEILRLLGWGPEGSRWIDLASRWAEGPSFTFPSNRPLAQIDYIFASERLLSMVTGFGLVNSLASDHLAVYAEFTWEESETPSSPEPAVPIEGALPETPEGTPEGGSQGMGQP